MVADLRSVRVEEVGLGTHECPFVPLRLCGAALVDLHALCGNDHDERFLGSDLELLRQPGGVRWLREGVAASKQDREEARECKRFFHGIAYPLLTSEGS